jgi:hypothetical protein
MKSFALLASVLSLSAQAALADNLVVSYQDGPATAELNGRAGGTASQLFQILDKAGYPIRHFVDGSAIDGKDLSASVAFLNGAVYNATIVLDTGNTYQTPPADGNPSKIDFQGPAAQELYEAMVKADVLIRPIMILGLTSRGTKNVICSQTLNRAPVVYSCTITAGAN